MPPAGIVKFDGVIVALMSSSDSNVTFQVDGPPGRCDEDQASTIAIGPGGVVSVAFINEQHQAAWEPGEQFENQYMVVQSRDGGVTWSKPVHIVDLEDGSRDYPINVYGSQTLTGFREHNNDEHAHGRPLRVR